MDTIDIIVPPSKALADALDKHDQERAKLIAHAADARYAEDCMRETGVGSHVAVMSHGTAYYIELPPDASLQHAIAPVMRYLRRMGYRRRAINQHPERGVVQVMFTGADDKPSNLFLYVSIGYREGAACRFVQTGEKTVPVYELQCAK